MISYWIDDRIDPQDRLKNEKLEKTIWLKEIIPALEIVEKNSENIEYLYLDYFMDHYYIYGNEFLFLIMYMGKEKFKNLKTIYLHSSDEGMVDDMLFKYEKDFENIGIKLTKANY